MKHFLTCAFCLLLLTGLHAQDQVEPTYNQALADSLGADEYGMKSYMLVLLKTGPTRLDNQEEVNAHFRSHMTNIQQLAKEGKLIVAGPVGKNDLAYRGIFILNTTDTVEAAQWLSGDGAVASGLLEPVYISWYGSAALPMYLPYSEEVAKKRP